MHTKRELLFAGNLLSLAYPVFSLAQETPAPPVPPQPPWMWPGHWHMWSGAWGVGWLCAMLMFLLIVICAVSFYVGRNAGPGHHYWGPWHMMNRSGGMGRPWGDPTYSALQILNERFAKGEISKQEYEEKRAAIRSSTES